jgi:hypothetical protein
MTKEYQMTNNQWAHPTFGDAAAEYAAPTGLVF